MLGNKLQKSVMKGLAGSRISSMEEYGTAAGIPLDSFYDGRLGEEEKRLLYDEDTVLVEKPDVRSGVAPHHYADIEPENNPHTTNFHGSKEFASIAFW